MGAVRPHVTVCICTYKRPRLLAKLLGELRRQVTGDAFTFSIVVVDNDPARAAQPVAEEFIAAGGDLVYAAESQPNIARARNRAVAEARGDFIAFIDDDEYPVPQWLALLIGASAAWESDGVLAPVKPYFEHEPPRWLVQGGFFERQGHPTGTEIGLSDARTGNVLLRRELFAGMDPPFRLEFGSGGEDVDFFRRCMAGGRRFHWCDEAVAYELVPPERCTRRYLLHRAWLRGQNNVRRRAGMLPRVLKSLVAVAGYSLALPVLLLAGQQHFMKYLVKICDHGGLVLAYCGVRPIGGRS